MSQTVERAVEHRDFAQVLAQGKGNLAERRKRIEARRRALPGLTGERRRVEARALELEEEKLLESEVTLSRLAVRRAAAT